MTGPRIYRSSGSPVVWGEPGDVVLRGSAVFERADSGWHELRGWRAAWMRLRWWLAY